jgi:hypothetical protein
MPWRLIVTDSTAFSYQTSDLKLIGCLIFLRSTPFVFLDSELGNLRSHFDYASALATEK